MLDLQIGCLLSLEVEASADNLYVHNAPSWWLFIYSTQIIYQLKAGYKSDH